MTGLIATVWLAERALNGARVVGMLLGLAGLAIMLLGSQQLGPQAAYGILGMVFSVIAYSVSAVAVKRIGADVPALATTIGGLMVTVPLLVIVYLLAGESLPAIVSYKAMWSIIYLGIVGSCAGVCALLLCPAPRRGDPRCVNHADYTGAGSVVWTPVKW